MTDSLTKGPEDPNGACPLAPKLLTWATLINTLTELISSWATGDGGFLVAQAVKYPPAMQETWVQSLGWEDPLEKEMATHSRILAWRIPWTEEPGGLQSIGSQRIGHD